MAGVGVSHLEDTFPVIGTAANGQPLDSLKSDGPRDGESTNGRQWTTGSRTGRVEVPTSRLFYRA